MMVKLVFFFFTFKSYYTMMRESRSERANTARQSTLTASAPPRTPVEEGSYVYLFLFLFPAYLYGGGALFGGGEFILYHQVTEGW